MKEITLVLFNQSIGNEILTRHDKISIIHFLWLLFSSYLITTSSRRFICVTIICFFISLAYRARIGFLFKTEIFPKQLSLLRDIAFDCLSYNFAIRGRAPNVKFSSRFLSNRPLLRPISSIELNSLLLYVLLSTRAFSIFIYNTLFIKFYTRITTRIIIYFIYKRKMF